jgi:opacity protein-like surface antigen
MKKIIALGILALFCQSVLAQGLVQPCQPAKRGYCILAATFSKPVDARRYEKALQARTHYRSHTVCKKNRCLVIIGPIQNKIQAQQIAPKLPTPYQAKTHRRPSVFHFKWPRTIHRQWFLTMGGGTAFPSFGHTNISVPNNSGFPSPYNQDAYTVHQKIQPLFTLGLGQRFENASQWLPAYSLGLYYQHFFATNMGNQITQYTAPSFTNYQYNWDLSSDALLIGGKLNILRFWRLLPYVTASVGCAFNKSSGYSESALPGLTDTRVSPGYQAKTLMQLAYNLGAGFDFQLTKSFMLAAEYQFQNLGNTSLGHGSGTWSNESLNLGRYRANTALVSLTYLFR